MLYQIFSLLQQALVIYSFVVFAYVLLSWLPGARDSSIGQFLGKIVEPYLDPFRRIIPPIGIFDISPIVAIFSLHLAAQGVGVLYQMLV